MSQKKKVEQKVQLKDNKESETPRKPPSLSEEIGKAIASSNKKLKDQLLSEVTKVSENQNYLKSVGKLNQDAIVTHMQLKENLQQKLTDVATYDNKGFLHPAAEDINLQKIIVDQQEASQNVNLPVLRPTQALSDNTNTTPNGKP